MFSTNNSLSTKVRCYPHSLWSKAFEMQGLEQSKHAKESPKDCHIREVSGVLLFSILSF